MTLLTPLSSSVISKVQSVWLTLCKTHICSCSDAVVEVATYSISGDEGTTIELCARLTSTSGDILRDIDVYFELTPDTAGTVVTFLCGTHVYSPPPLHRC